MTLFVYTGVDGSKTTRQGTVEATSLEHASLQLASKGISVRQLRVAQPVGMQPVDNAYLPLTDTLRLYAGWLLAWYGVVYLIGFYRITDRLEWEIPFIDELFQSTLVLRFAFGTFLFLLLTTLHRALRGGVFLGFLLALIGLGSVILFVANT